MKFKILGNTLIPFAIVFVITFLVACTIRPLDPTTGKPIIEESAADFNAGDYAQEIWASELIPVLSEQSNDIVTVLDALHENQAQASETYGRHEGRQPYSFMVHGTGVVTEVNLESRAGLAYVDVTEDGTADFALAIGPVIRGTALRDAMPFIAFNQFTNQMDYAGVSNELHLLVNSEVLALLGDMTSLDAKSISFYGAFTLA